MKRKPQYTLNSKDVHDLAIRLLSQLPLSARGPKVQPADIFRVLVFAAACRSSIDATCTALERAPSPSKVLAECRDQLGHVQDLEYYINDLLAVLLPKHLKKKPVHISIDLHDVPFHGKLEGEHEDETRRSKPKDGTSTFFTYATAYAVVKGRRYTIAMIRVLKHDDMHEVLKLLNKHIRLAGLKSKLLLLDRGFYSVRVIRYLIRGKYAFIMPVIKRGKKPDEEGGPTKTQAFAQLKKGGRYRYTLTSQDDGKVTFDLAVVCVNMKGRKGRYHREAWLYATNRVSKRPLGWIRKTYRSRWGIETSYRQKKQAKIKTSTKHPALRLLFFFVATMLRNIWVWLHEHVIAIPRQGGRTLQPSLLRFGTLLLWLVEEIKILYGVKKEIAVPSAFQEAYDAI